MKQKFSNFEIETPKGVKIYSPRSTKEETEWLMWKYMGRVRDEDIDIYKEAIDNGNIYRDQDGYVNIVDKDNKTYNSGCQDIVKDDSFNMDYSIWGHTKSHRNAKGMAIKNNLYKVLSSIKSCTPIKAVVKRLDESNKYVYIDIPQFELHNVLLYRPRFDYREDMLSFYPVGSSFYVYAEKDNMNNIRFSDNSFIPDIFTSMDNGVQVMFTVYKHSSFNTTCICEAEYDGVKCKAYVNDINNTLKVGDVFYAPFTISKSCINALMDNGVWNDYAMVVSNQPVRKLHIYAVTNNGYKVYEIFKVNDKEEKITLFVPFKIAVDKDLPIDSVLRLQIEKIVPESEMAVFKV